MDHNCNKIHLNENVKKIRTYWPRRLCLARVKGRSYVINSKLNNNSKQTKICSYARTVYGTSVEKTICLIHFRNLKKKELMIEIRRRTTSFFNWFSFDCLAMLLTLIFIFIFTPPYHFRQVSRAKWKQPFMTIWSECDPQRRKKGTAFSSPCYFMSRSFSPFIEIVWWVLRFYWNIAANDSKILTKYI